MTRVRPYLLRLRRFLLRYSCQMLFFLALVLLALSTIRPDYEGRLRRQVARVERSLHKRELLAERYASLALEAREQNWIDFDAGRLLSGRSLEALGQELLDCVLAVAGGRQTRNEINGFHDLAIFKQGVTL